MADLEIDVAYTYCNVTNTFACKTHTKLKEGGLSNSL
jgi:hypothetical protein